VEKKMEEAKQKLNLPALFLLITGGLNIVLCILDMLVQIVQVIMGRTLFFGGDTIVIGKEAIKVTPPSSGQLIITCLITIFALLVLSAANGVIVYGAMKMKEVRSYNLSLTAAILATIPLCSLPCCCLGTPVGIWALVLLMNQDIKTAFRG
jgi:hypothetical protein